MLTTRKDNPAELLRLAIKGLDEQIAELQAIHTQLTSMIGQPSASLAVKVAAPQKQRMLSDEAREKISAAAKARWARERKAKAKAQKAKPVTKKAESKASPAKARPTPAGAKKGKSESSTSAMGAKTRKAAR